MKQITNNIMMIEPVSFNYNTETAINNYYQINNTALSKEEIQQKALKEFKEFVSLLRSKNINVIVFKDTENPKTPDSIFPNNWVSFHIDGEIVLYPMYAKNRRLERRNDIIQKLRDDFIVTKINDFSYYENQELYLEGTGSMILDRENKICYAAISDRTNKNIVNDFCNQLNFKPILFTSNQDVRGERLAIYHTNVMMCITTRFAIVCLDSIDCDEEKDRVIDILNETKKEIISISEEQTNKFAGNMLEVEGDKKYLVMSKSAYSCLTENQIKKINKYCEILYSDLSTIEDYGGGSARCMMAEIFLPLKND
ncbi:MAG: citrulline utilization hydrolase CtlX [Flavobacteriales bacterium]